MVEFALVIPIFLLLLVAIFDLGRAVFAYNTLTNAAREGARLAAVNQYQPSIVQRAKNSTSIVELNDPSVTVGYFQENADGTLGVACPGRIGDYSTNPSTQPYGKISLIRFLGPARFQTVRWPDIADHPRPLSPAARQHNCSQLLHVLGALPGSLPTLARSWAAAAGTPPSSAQPRAPSSSGLPGGSAHTARRALPQRTPGRGLGCDTARRHTGSTRAAAHTGRRPVPGGYGGGWPGTSASTRPGGGGAACPPSAA